MKFSKEVLQELTWEDECEGLVSISNEIYDTSRWSVHYRQIFKFEDKFYETTYSVGATESQEERPYEYAGDEVECHEVQAVEKTITVYERV